MIKLTGGNAARGYRQDVKTKEQLADRQKRRKDIEDINDFMKTVESIGVFKGAE